MTRVPMVLLLGHVVELLTIVILPGDPTVHPLVHCSALQTLLRHRVMASWVDPCRVVRDLRGRHHIVALSLRLGGHDLLKLSAGWLLG